MPLGTGQVVGGRYSVQQPLGAGGMGAVYRAWDSRLNAPVALKEMVPQPGISAQMLDSLKEQFRREATVLANLDHPGLVNVLDFFEDRGNAYLVMRFVAGESLAARIRCLGQGTFLDINPVKMSRSNEVKEIDRNKDNNGQGQQIKKCQKTLGHNDHHVK